MGLKAGLRRGALTVRGGHGRERIAPCAGDIPPRPDWAVAWHCCAPRRAARGLPLNSKDKPARYKLPKSTQECHLPLHAGGGCQGPQGKLHGPHGCLRAAGSAQGAARQGGARTGGSKDRERSFVRSPSCKSRLVFSSFVLHGFHAAEASQAPPESTQACAAFPFLLRPRSSPTTKTPCGTKSLSLSSTLR
jgi:hypothetical protein